MPRPRFLTRQQAKEFLPARQRRVNVVCFQVQRTEDGGCRGGSMAGPQIRAAYARAGRQIPPEDLRPLGDVLFVVPGRVDDPLPPAGAWFPTFDR